MAAASPLSAVLLVDAFVALLDVVAEDEHAAAPTATATNTASSALFPTIAVLAFS
jgi:hypothetical protein